MSTLTGVGGLGIHWRSWEPGEPARALVAIAHGAGEHGGRYQHVAERLVNEGYAVYAIDHRGHGRSDGPRAVIDRLNHAVSDLDSLVKIAGEEHPGVPMFLVGHSVGGTISVMYATRHQPGLAGLILSGALAALEAPPAPLRLVVRVLSAVKPGLPLVAIDPALVSRDPIVVRTYELDPLVHHGKLPVRTVVELAGAIDSFPDGAAAITIPTLIMYGTADRLCPVEGSLMLAERIAAEDKTLKAYDGLYHEIFNEPERDRVLDDLCTWLAAHIK